MASARETPVFVSYSHLDDEFRKRFETHMAQLHREGVRTWFDGDITPGAELDPNIRRALKASGHLRRAGEPELSGFALLL